MIEQDIEFLCKNWASWMAIYYGGIGQDEGACFHNDNGDMTYYYRIAKPTDNETDVILQYVEVPIGHLTSLEQVIIKEDIEHVEFETINSEDDLTTNPQKHYTSEDKNLKVDGSAMKKVGPANTFLKLQLLAPHLVGQFLEMIFDKPIDIEPDQEGKLDITTSILSPIMTDNTWALLVVTDDGPILVTDNIDIEDSISVEVLYPLDLDKIAEFINPMLAQSTKYYPKIDLSKYMFHVATTEDKQ